MNMNSGYSGWSMSLRAREAYENGEAPISKWSKTAIMYGVAEVIDDKATVERISKYTLPFLKMWLLRWSSWHHTSKFANETDFYELDESRLVQYETSADERRDIDEWFTEFKNRKDKQC